MACWHGYTQKGMKKKGKKKVPNCVPKKEMADGGLSKAAGYSPVMGNNKFGYPSGGIPIRKGETMDGMQIVYKLKKEVTELSDSVSDILINGEVDNWDKYQYMVGQLKAYQQINQEISNLLENKEQDENEGTVVKLNTEN